MIHGLFCALRSALRPAPVAAERLPFLSPAQFMTESLQDDAVLKDGDLPIPLFFRTGPSAGRYLQNEPVQPPACIGHGFSFRYRPGIEIHPSALFLKKALVRGNLQGRGRGAKGRAPSGRKQDQMGAGGGKGRGGNQVVAGTAQ